MTNDQRWSFHKEINAWYDDAFRGTTDRHVEYYQKDGIKMVRLTAKTDEGRNLLAEYSQDDLSHKLDAIKAVGLQRQEEAKLVSYSR